MNLLVPYTIEQSGAPASTPLTLNLLGPTDIVLNGTPLRFAYDHVLALLIYLAVESNRAHRRSALAGLLWPEQPEHAARHSLSQALFTLRRTLHPDGDTPLIQATRDTVRFDADQAWCDVVLFRALVEPDSAAAIACYRGDFLQGLGIGGSAEFEEWALVTREQLREQACAALRHLSDPAVCADAEAACRYARRWVELDPLDEEAHRSTMVLLARTGQRTAALVQFDRCREVLETELGITPEAATVALYEELRRDPPVTPPAPQRRALLPVLPTPLIDRTQELAALSTLLARPTHRLITMIGPGGVGKTRLALHAAHTNSRHFADGVYIVSLAPVRGAEHVLSAVAQTLGVQQNDGRALEQLVQAALADSHALLVLDNCEHVLPAVTALVIDLLAAAPHLVVLATSRAALHLSHEHCFPLAPLGLPEDDHAPDMIIASPAVALFIERAKAVRPAVVLDYRAIAAICRRLDGLPLAIELAAIHSRLLDPANLLARLAPSLPLLNGGPRDLPERQQTLRATIDWSYQLLGTREQALFRRLSVFAGGWSVATAEVVCADAPGSSTIAGMTVLEGLTALLHASLIVETTGCAGEPRCTMLETIREYALEQLVTSEDHERISKRHGECIAALADEATTAIIGAQGAHWSALLLTEHANLRTAIRWALDAGEAQIALRIGRGVWRFCWRSGFAAEGLHGLTEALACEGDVAPILRAEALRAAGALAWSIGDYTQAHHWLDQGLLLAQTLPDRQIEASICTVLGVLNRSEGHLEQARSHFEQSHRISVTLGNPHATRSAIMGLAEIATRLGQLDAAAAGYTNCIALNTAAGDAEGTAAAKRRLAYIYWLQQRNAAEAKVLCDESLALCQAIDDKYGLSHTLLVLGNLVGAAGDHDTALTHYRASLRLRKTHERQENCAQTLQAIALTLGECGQIERAISLLSAALHIRAVVCTPLTAFEATELDPLIAAWRTQQGETAFDKLWQNGQALSLDQAVALALNEPD